MPATPTPPPVASPGAGGPTLHIVINAGSGRQNSDATQAVIAGVLGDAQRAYRFHRADDPAQLPEIARGAVAAAQADRGVVVAAGGDGTINAVAQAVLGSGCEFGVLPQGTFNYFSRTHGIPADTAQAARVLVTGTARPVQVGLVNDRVFLVNASLGLYPKLLEDREAFKRQFGRSRLVAFGAGLVTLFGVHRKLRLHFEYGSLAHKVRTPTLFVGNNRLQMEQIGAAGAFERGHLAAITLRPVGTFGMLGLLLHGALSRLADAENVESFGFDHLSVRPARFRRVKPIKVATDGEVSWLEPPLEFRVSPVPLQLLVPTSTAMAEGTRGAA
ncbi:MAG: diacylglycerol kinase [Rhizobacter sp.]|nr:diacylglycerol kinase [Burkholderiaceae bacterium]MCO5124251.1 diacylglycerol kinase [Rhizobacter sp.]